MPPQQEGCASASGGRRDPLRPTELNFAGPSQSGDPVFPSSPLSALGSPHRSPYSQLPSTPRPDYSQNSSEPFTQSPPYISPQTPGTPRPHSDPLCLVQYSQQPPGPGHRPSPSQQNSDPYSSAPGTPRPSGAERFPRSPGDASSIRTQRPDQFHQQSAVRAQKAPADAFTPEHGGTGSSPLASESFPPAQQQVAPTGLLSGRGSSQPLLTASACPLQLSPLQQHRLDPFPRNAISQVQKHAGMFEASGFSRLAVPANPNPFEQGTVGPGPMVPPPVGPDPVGPGPSPADKTKSSDVAQMDVNSLSGPGNMLPQQGDSEEKLRQVRPNLETSAVLLVWRQSTDVPFTALQSSGFSFFSQRQRLRQLILRQQQQKSVSRQEKVLQEGAPGPAHLWLQKESISAAPSDPFGRPPPPYPGTVRPTEALRCAGNVTADMARSSGEAAGPRQSLAREQGLQGQVQR